MTRRRKRKQVFSSRSVGAWRRYLVLVVLAIGAVTILGRAFQLQVLQRDFLTGEGNKRAVRTVTVRAHRGAIRDRHGKPLALSAPVESLWVIPSELLAAPEYLQPLSKLLGYKNDGLQKFLKARSKRHFAYLRRHMDPGEAKRVLAMGAPGVFSQREYRRYYPAAEVAGHVVGFTNIDGRGQEGIEAAWETTLAGYAGARRVVRDRTGRIVEEAQDFQTAEAGAELYLTLDLQLQYLAYRELKRAVDEHDAKGGLIVLLDPRNGEVLAMASQPGYNPNRSSDRQSDGLRNRAVTDVFEPGSTIKPLLVAQALETGKFNADTRINTDPGILKVGSLTVKDTHKNGKVSLARLLSRSSNVGAAFIGMALGPHDVWSGYRKFGLGEITGAGFPGEATGVLRHFQDWGDIATATASYGYGLSVNALQMVRAYAALANDGLLPSLTLVRSMDAVPPERAVSAEVAKQIRALLSEVTVGDGTGVRASVPGYSVAGKTGTVRKPVNGGYADDRHQAVFIGMIPADRPQLVGLVMIDEPANEQYYGGLVAGPVFSNVMQPAMQLLQVPPDNASTASAPTSRPKT